MPYAPGIPSKKSCPGCPVKTPKKHRRRQGSKNRYKVKPYTDENVLEAINLVREDGQGRNQRNIVEAYDIPESSLRNQLYQQWKDGPIVIKKLWVKQIGESWT